MPYVVTVEVVPPWFGSYIEGERTCINASERAENNARVVWRKRYEYGGKQDTVFLVIQMHVAVAGENLAVHMWAK